MPHPNFVLLYVDQPQRSAEFYAGLLDSPPVEASPTFALFALPSGVMLGLWSRHTAQPAPAGGAGAMELAFAVDGDDAVRDMHQAWTRRGLPVIQAPTHLDFGFTFVATDPDGHRLRVFAPSAP